MRRGGGGGDGAVHGGREGRQGGDEVHLDRPPGPVSLGCRGSPRRLFQMTSGSGAGAGGARPFWFGGINSAGSRLALARGSRRCPPAQSKVTLARQHGVESRRPGRLRPGAAARIRRDTRRRSRRGSLSANAADVAARRQRGLLADEANGVEAVGGRRPRPFPFRRRLLGEQCERHLRGRHRGLVRRGRGLCRQRCGGMYRRCRRISLRLFARTS